MSSKTKSGRSAAYSEAEVDVLLDIVEDRLPFGQEQWERVGIEFRSKFSNAPVVRETESLRAKFKTLRNHKKPTGDPDCPPAVVRAKRAYRDIEVKTDVISGDDNEEGVNDVAIFDDVVIDEEEGEYLGIPEPAMEVPVTPLPRSALLPVTPLSRSSISNKRTKTGDHTTLRTGHTVEELKTMGKGTSSGSGGKTTKLRNTVDSAIAENEATTQRESGYLEYLMMQQAEDRRAEIQRRADEERRAEEREEREERRRQEREEREDRLRAEREEREDRQQQQFQMMMMALIGNKNLESSSNNNNNNKKK